MNMVVHPDTVQMAHQYTCAAAKQKKFLEFYNAFWEKGFGAYAQSQGRDKAALGEDNILKFTATMGFDVQKLKADANSAECKQRVEEDMAELKKFRVSGTPAFFINGFHVGGGIPKQTFKKIKRLPPFPPQVKDESLEIQYEFVSQGRAAPRRRLEVRGSEEAPPAPEE